MRRLLLVRHAKAADSYPDRDRTLTPAGLAAAGAIGRWLATQQITVDRAVVSPASRTRQTWEAAGSPAAPVTDERVYDNILDDLITVVRETPADVATLAVIGHNPSIHALADRVDEDEFADGFPTGGVALFEIAVPWSDVGARAGHLVAFARPR